MESLKKTQKKYIAPNAKRKTKNFILTILFPVIGILFLFGGSFIGNRPAIMNDLEFNNIILTILTTLIACFALNTNLNSGRMDFSLGATGILATSISYLLIPDKTASWFPIAFLVLSIVVGVLIGLFNGLIFTWLKIPAIVVSLGMCLIFEGAAYFLSNNEGNIKMFEATGLYDFIVNPTFIISVIIIASVFMLITLKYSKFGHDKLSILFGQKVAVDTGINEIKNAIICYGLAGALIALYTYINSIAIKQTIDIPTNLGSAMAVMQNFLPIFLGGLIAKHSNEVIGLICGVFSVVLFKQGLSNSGMDLDVINLIVSILIFVILTYMVNWTNWMTAIKDKIRNHKLEKIDSKK